MGIALFIALMVYLILLQLSYLTVFSVSEALVHASAIRYVGSMMIAIIIILLGVSLYYLKDDKKLTKYHLLITAGVLFFTPIRDIADATFTSGVRNYHSIEFNERYIKFAEPIHEFIEPGSSVGSIYQHIGSDLFTVIYHSTPVKVTWSPMINLDNIDYLESVLENDYLIVVYANEFMKEHLMAKYDFEISSWSIYRINNENDERTFERLYRLPRRYIRNR
jgi:hypothetical protein